MDYPRFLYKQGDPLVTATANDDSERAALLADGWKDTVPELYEVGSRIVAQSEPVVAVAVVEPEKAEDKAPSRAELEAMAKEIGLTYHHRTGDAKLAEMIEKALANGVE
jgi:hypothetical protein